MVYMHSDIAGWTFALEDGDCGVFNISESLLLTAVYAEVNLFYL
jgi:hypothetical protein